ncbi:hypothetical protein OH146_12075 [Salinibacterium sp. SYSU T00001]|uniref:hypothetical protein n=1 Tax=Homoserinimonas sedimenticola TaxID=2986805 RepID=UPI0022364975|nr:hypothetical protein [Salinibacterium sedimenticola]MCW4386511.1 hypothetical protein [Salinibacterium sedimenticola]
MHSNRPSAFPTAAPAVEAPSPAFAPAPVESEDHLGLSLAPVSSLFVSLIPANSHRRPARARSTFRAVA